MQQSVIRIRRTKQEDYPRSSALKINMDQSNLPRGRIAAASLPNCSFAFAPGGNIGLTVWLQFLIVCFARELGLQISLSSGDQGPI